VTQGEGPEFEPLYWKKKKRKEFSLVQWLQPIILAIQEAEARRIMVQSQPRQKFHETPPQPMMAWWHMPVIPATLGNTNSRITVQVHHTKMGDPI
jgi:hypothetical protein